LTSRLRTLVDELPAHTIATFAIRISGIAAEFVCLLLMARVFGATAFGGYAFAMSVVSVAVVPALFGFDRLLIREVAALYARNDSGLLRRHAARAGRIVLCTSIATGIVLWLVATRTTLVPPGLGGPLATAALLVPIIAALRLHQAVLQGLGQVPVGLVSESIVQPGMLAALTVAVAALAYLPRTATTAITLQAASAAVALIVAASLLRSRLPRATSPADLGDGKSGPWLAAGATFMWLIAMSVALVNVDTLLVGVQLGPANAGAYRAASQLAMFVGFPVAAVSIAIAPSISALYASRRTSELRLLVRRAARVIAAASALTAMTVVLAGRPILHGLGPGFESGYPVTLILSAAYLLHAAMATSSYLLFMTAHERLAAAFFSLGFGVHVLANLFLVPRFGLTGAAIAMGCALVVVSAGCAMAAWRAIGIDATIFGSLRSPGHA
jgi:O-antigen/teichoic acid export membrane protein